MRIGYIYICKGGVEIESSGTRGEWWWCMYGVVGTSTVKGMIQIDF